MSSPTPYRLPDPRTSALDPRIATCTTGIAILLSACTYAPPARIGGGGAPGRSLAQSGELNLGVMSPSVHAQEQVSGYGGLGFSPAEDWRVEAGFETLFEFPRGYLGGRYNFWNTVLETKGATADVELGGMLGAGANGCERRNAFCDTGDGIWDPKRITGGAYTGLGVGYRFDWFNLYGRTRLQVSGAQGIPATFWYAAQGGLQFNIREYFHTYLASGAAGFVNAQDAMAIAWIPIELGVVFTFGGR